MANRNRHHGQEQRAARVRPASYATEDRVKDLEAELSEVLGSIINRLTVLEGSMALLFDSIFTEDESDTGDNIDPFDHEWPPATEQDAVGMGNRAALEEAARQQAEADFANEGNPHGD